MIQIRIDYGLFCDIADDTKLSFAWKNSSFFFENIELMRSQEFSLPKTEKNNIIFDYGNRLDSSAMSCRVKHFAELFFDGKKMDGTLYVSEWSGKDYKVVFVENKYSKLRALKDAGKLSMWSFGLTNEYGINGQCDYDTWFAGATFERDFPLTLLPYQNANLTEADQSGNYGYNLSHVLSAKWLVEAVCGRFGLSVGYANNNIEQRIADVAIVLAGAKKTTAAKVGAYNGGSVVPSIFSDFFETYSVKLFPYAKVRDYTTYKLESFSYNYYGTFGFPSFFVWRAKRKLRVKVTGASSLYDFGCAVFGSGKITPDSIRFPEYDAKPAGVFPQLVTNKEFEVDEGEVVYFFSRSNWNVSARGFDLWQSAEQSLTGNITLSVESIDDKPITAGETFYLQGNAPDCDAIALLKTIANATGCRLEFGTDSITFGDWAFQLNSAIDVEKKTISVGEVKRTLLDYAQRNVFEFDNNAFVLDNRTAEITLPNATIEAVKTFYKFPFSDANRATIEVRDWFGGHVGNGVEIRDFSKTARQETNGDFTYTVYDYERILEKNVLCSYNMKNRVSPNGLHLLNVYVPKELQDIFTQSTSVKVKLAMKSHEFFELKNDTVFRYQGLFFVPLQVNWSDGVATIDMCRVA